MRVAIFVEHYPATYKPYFDTQFADLVRAGHDVRINAAGALSDVPSSKVQRWALQERTAYYPGALRDLPRRMPSLMRHRPDAMLGLREAFATTAGVATRRRIVDIARALSICGGTPDIGLIHGLTAALSVLPWLRRALLDTPLALYYHGGELPTTPSVPDQLARNLFAAVDLVFTNTAFSRDHAIARGCPADRVHVLPVGFDIADYAPPSPRTYRRDGTLRLLSAGRMSEEKGFEYAIRAVHRLVEEGVRDLRYELTGDGYYRERLEHYVRANDLEPYIGFLGTLPMDSVIRAMGECDALVLPSIQVGNWVENQACAVQEAMLMHAPVIATRTGGVPQSVPDSMLPFICAPGSVDELSEAIRRIHVLDAASLAQLGDSGRSFVERNYDIRQLNQLMLEMTAGVRTT
jgi:colanic acid/amylovoran biosynthesis glycosyltransferase